MEEFAATFQTETYMQVWRIMFGTWPIWLPVAALSLFFSSWLDYKRRQWINKQGSILLEVRLPRDIERSPAAMELVLNGIWEDAVGSVTDVFLDGRVRDWFSLEIVSIGGQVKFYIWAFPKWKNTIQSRIYAEYPGAEIFEVEDYSLKVAQDPEKTNMFGFTTALVKPDAYPIKTYIDYELDKGGKEQEEIVDPIVPLLEFLGSLKPDEQAWTQILIQAHRKEVFTKDAKIKPKGDRTEGIKKELKNILEKDAHAKPEKDKPATFQNISKTQEDTYVAIERNAGKLAYDAMIRGLYIAPKDTFDKSKIGGLVGSFRQFGSSNLNGFKPDWTTSITYAFTDLWDRKKNRNQREILEAYKRRSFFNLPFRHDHGKPYILTVEEIATIYHFPGAVAATPTLSRVPSRRAEAPSNLPV